MHAKAKLTEKEIEDLEKERQLVKERLAQREREFDLLVNTKPSRVKEIVTEGRNKRFNEIERKFEFMRKVQEEQTQAKLRKDRFEKASMRFGNIQNIEDIDKVIEDLDAQHHNISGMPPLNRSALPKSNRFTSPKLEEELRKSQLQLQKLRHEEDSDLQKQYAEMHRDRELKRKLISAYGPRIANFNSQLSTYQKQKLQKFYEPISEEKQIVLNSKLSNDLITHISETPNHDFMETHRFYTQQYRTFLRNERYSDGLYRQILKDFSDLKGMKKVLNNIPKLSQPRIYSNKNESTKEALDIKQKYKDKMELVGNKFLKYDLSNDTILEEVGRFIKYGDGLENSVFRPDPVNLEQRNADKREARKKGGLVDQLMSKVYMRKNGSKVELTTSNPQASQIYKGTAPHASILKKSGSRKRTTAHARFGS